MTGREYIKPVIKTICVFCTVGILNTAHVDHMLYAASSGGDSGIRALDATGHEIVFDADNHAVNAGPVRFIFDEGSLNKGEIYLYDDGSTLNPVEDGEYDLFPDGEVRDVSFYKLTSEGEKYRVYSGTFHVDFMDGIYDEPEADLSETDDGYKLIVNPLSHSHVYCDIIGSKNGIAEEITEKTEFEIKKDGVYRISVYAEDGMGHRTYADIPTEIMLDTTPPVLDDVALPVAISNEPVYISISASDEVSGLEGIYIRAGEAEPVAADAIEIKPPFRGRVEYWASDHMGNNTDRICLGEDIIVDDAAPEISVEAAEIDMDTLNLIVGASDDTSGCDTVTISAEGRTLYSGTGQKERVSIDISDIPYGLKSYEISATDKAGNKTVSAFTIEKQDGEAPDIRIKGASDKGIYGRSVEIDVSAEDDSGDNCTLKETVKRYTLSGEFEEESSYTGGSLYFNDSGIYIVKVEAWDSAGNVSRRSTAFAIDKDAPVIRGLLGLNGSELKSFMLKLDDELVSDDSLVEVKVMLNGMEYGGQEITTDGKYSLTILAMDEFGNSSEKVAGFEIKGRSGAPADLYGKISHSDPEV